METMIKPLFFRCCFCGEQITPNEIDPCNINIVANYDKYTPDSPSQDFYCHFKCLKDRLHKDMTGYFEEINFS